MRSIVAVVAGVLAVVVSAGPAAGQPSVLESDQGLATPPPLPLGTGPPTDLGVPDLDYRQKEPCAESVRGNEPREMPWGQSVLRFDQLHRFATGKGQAVAVIDTGVNPHDFLGERLSGGGDYVIA